MIKGKTRIVIVDDEPRYVRAVKYNLEASGYEVLSASEGQAAIDLIELEQPDLLVLDLRLPGMDGYEICQRVREFSAVPIIMLTARAEEDDKVRGLDLGADDYLTKPFSADELLARVRALLRRTNSPASGDSNRPYSGGERICVGDVCIELDHPRVFIGQHEINLTATEYHLLVELARQPGRILVPDVLLHKVWGSGYAGEVRLLWQMVHRLRQKIEVDPANPKYILTRAGVGYMFAEPESQQ
jgi:DNA-binding response OmpR family regulator